MTEQEQKQVAMHTDFFDRCEFAIQNGFYLEAVFMEYAAIESRLESICGVLGFPCGKECPCRKDIKISARIECLRAYRNKNERIFARTKLPKSFFTEHGELKEWVDKRNRYVHGLYKDETAYKNRMMDNKKLAEDGLKHAKLLYNEAKRIRRLQKGHSDQFDGIVAQCKEKGCKAYL